MSDTLDLTTVSDEPVESNVQVEITDAPETEGPGEPVEEETTEETPEEPVEEPVETAGPVEEEEAPEEAVEEPVEEVAPEEPVEEVAETPAEPVTTEEPIAVEAPVEEEAPVAPVEQVAADIRNILTEVPATPVETSEPVVTGNLCSLKTLVEVLGKWSGNEIRRRNVETLLKEGTEVDENLDDIEKVVEVLKLWIREGGSTFREHNHFKKLDEYTLSGESRNLSEEKKVEVLKTLTELVVNVSQRKVDVNNIYSIFL